MFFSFLVYYICFFLSSAYSIAHRLVKTLFDDMDCLQKCPLNTSLALELVWQYFGVDNQMDMLQFYYTKFVKSHIAGLARVMGEVRNDFCKE